MITGYWTRQTSEGNKLIKIKFYNVRKLIMLLLAFTIGMIVPATHVEAQIGSAYTFSRAAGDSLVTADTVSKVITITKGYKKLTVQTNIKKGTGTLDGKAYLYASMDGTTYQLTDSATIAAVPTITGVTTTYTHTARIEKDHPGAVKYIISVTQTGSLTASPVQVQFTARE